MPLEASGMSTRSFSLAASFAAALCLFLGARVEAG
jgi:hypothetical protein